MTVDPRLARTRDSLRITLSALLAERPLNSISVALLCREAGVHRTTFYGHAPSVHQFALAEFSRDIDLLTTVNVEPGAESAEHVAVRYRESLRTVLTHVVTERLAFRALLTSDTRGTFRSALESVLRPHALTALEVFDVLQVEGAPRSAVERSEAAAFISGAIVGAIDAWAVSDEVDAAAASSRITRLMPPWWPVHG